MARLKEIIALVNNKGGVAKTTSVQNIAAGIVRIDKSARVLCIDLDAQSNLSYLLGWNKSEAEKKGLKTVYEALREASSLPIYQSYSGEGQDRKARDRFYYCPASKYLSTVDNDLHHHMNSKMVLAKCFTKPLENHTDTEDITNIIDSFDYIIIDCPPAMNEVTFNAMGVATGIIIPLQLEGMSIQGLSEMIGVYREVKEDLNPNIELIGLLKVMTRDQLNTAKGFSKVLDDQFGDKVFKARIRRTDLINQAQTLRQHIFEYKPWDNPGSDYLAVVKELLERIKTEE